MSKYQKAFLLALGFTVLGTMIYQARTHGYLPVSRDCPVIHANADVGKRCGF